MKKEFKQILKLSSNAMLYVASIILVASLWIENNILGTTVVAMSVIAIVLFALSSEEIKDMFKEINVYYFVVLILLGISRILDSQTLFNVALAIFVILLLVYIFFTFIKKDNKDEVKNEVAKEVKKNDVNKGKKHKKKK